MYRGLGKGKRFRITILYNNEPQIFNLFIHNAKEMRGMSNKTDLFTEPADVLGMFVNRGPSISTLPQRDSISQRYITV